MGNETELEPTATAQDQGTGAQRQVHAGQVVEVPDLARFLEDADGIAEMNDRIEAGDVYVIKRAVDPGRIEAIKRYLSNLGRNSIPAYHPIAAGCPNFHRVNDDDERAYVLGCFHQFVFFPWNQDVFDLFGMLRPIYALRNELVGNPRDRFLGRAPELDCIARLSFQFYPAGKGHLNLHRDPVAHHQLAVPLMTMTDRGRDFQAGGGYVLDEGGAKIYTDEISEVGDFVFVNALVPHGVETVDPEAPLDWLSFRGRWVMLASINKLHDNDAISDAVDLEQP